MIPAASPPWARAEALGASVPELASFQDEPPQMRSGTVGKTGFLRLGFEHRLAKRSWQTWSAAHPTWCSARCIATNKCRVWPACS